MGAAVRAIYAHNSLRGIVEVSRRLVALPVTTTAVCGGRFGINILFIPSQKTPYGDVLISAAMTNPDRVGMNIARVPPTAEYSKISVEMPNVTPNATTITEALNTDHRSPGHQVDGGSLAEIFVGRSVTK
jgi:hypothetical protein